MIVSKKVLNFRIQKIGKSIGYIFFLTLMEQILISAKYYKESDTLILFIRDSLVMYLINTALIFIGISVLAAIGLLVKEILSRRLTYTQLWNLASYVVTVPTILFSILEAFYIKVPFGWFIKWILLITILFRYINFFPKPRKR